VTFDLANRAYVGVYDAVEELRLVCRRDDAE
jgi:hypothetical protein